MTAMRLLFLILVGLLLVAQRPATARIIPVPPNYNNDPDLPGYSSTQLERLEGCTIIIPMGNRQTINEVVTTDQSKFNLEVSAFANLPDFFSFFSYFIIILFCFSSIEGASTFAYYPRPGCQNGYANSSSSLGAPLGRST